MYTQNTPVHVKLWHKEFWYMAVANLLITASVYMFIPVLPMWLMEEEGYTNTETAMIMGIYGLGLYFFGGFCSALVQYFRRYKVYIFSALLMLVAVAGLYHLPSMEIDEDTHVAIITGLRFLFGASFGLAQMVLSSTLIIDTCESFKRTEANYSATWFSRFAFALGPIASIIIYKNWGFNLVLIASVACIILSILFIENIKFPFKAPDDNIKKFSLDRFYLPQGTWLFINLMLTAVVVGMMFTVFNDLMFYLMLMCGFLMSLIARKYVFENADLRSETLSGLFLIGAALLMMLLRKQMIVSYVAPAFIGMGVGLVGSRFLLFYIKLSRHCQRGTSQSSYFLSWESGIALGMFLGYNYFYGDRQMLLAVSLVITAVALLMYHFFTHTWYIKHKNR